MVKLGQNRFAFTFYDDVREQCTFSFNIVAVNDLDLTILDQIDHGGSDPFNECLEMLEDMYGVHDFGTNVDDDFYGFVSYEVDGPLRIELMQLWRQFFINQGLSVSNVTIC